ncbi:hypothetical protein E2C01_095345 [Portunus trituberculatus]|uniref:Uncharacterized protein n=1 Tax=Portunus trituberculatus TaxID=210409 RepID=A0A5B7JST1_PORTR|nr:hypothetical protein [Portunus trituberculatus]
MDGQEKTQKEKQKEAVRSGWTHYPYLQWEENEVTKKEEEEEEEEKEQEEEEEEGRQRRRNANLIGAKLLCEKT